MKRRHLGSSTPEHAKRAREIVEKLESYSGPPRDADCNARIRYAASDYAEAARAGVHFEEAGLTGRRDDLLAIYRDKLRAAIDACARGSRQVVPEGAGRFSLLEVDGTHHRRRR